MKTTTKDLSWSHRSILDLLQKHAGKVVSHHMIAKALWWDRVLPKSWLGMISIEINSLKRTIPHLADKIVNVHGKGYLYYPKMAK